MTRSRAPGPAAGCAHGLWDSWARGQPRVLSSFATTRYTVRGTVGYKDLIRTRTVVPDQQRGTQSAEARHTLHTKACLFSSPSSVLRARCTVYRCFWRKGSLLRNEPQYPTKGYAPHTSGRGGEQRPGGDNRGARGSGRVTWGLQGALGSIRTPPPAGWRISAAQI